MGMGAMVWRQSTAIGYFYTTTSIVIFILYQSKKRKLRDKM